MKSETIGPLAQPPSDERLGQNPQAGDGMADHQEHDRIVAAHGGLAVAMNATRHRKRGHSS